MNIYPESFLEFEYLYFFYVSPCLVVFSSDLTKLYFERTSFHKGVFLGPEYFNNILGTNSHIKGTCIATNFESNGPLVWCLLYIKSGWGNSILVLHEVIN